MTDTSIVTTEKPATTEERAAGGENRTSAAGGASLVAESRKYRKRAQAAEQVLEELRAELAQKTAQLAEKEAAIADLERRARIDGLLLEADAIDMESARLLTELAVRQMPEADVEEAVRDLRRTKPFLFRQGVMAASAQGARVGDRARPAVDDAANQAAASGTRADLLRYLRLKRRGTRAGAGA